MGDPDAEIVEYDIGGFYQLVENRPPVLAFKIQRHAFFITIEIDEIGAHALDRMLGILSQQATGALAFKGFDLDDFRSQICQSHGPEGAGKNMGQVEDAQSCKGFSHES